MKIVKKVSFSLLEVSLALFLGAVMIGFLFSSFTTKTKLKNQIQKTCTVVLKRKYVQEKLTQILNISCAELTCKDNKLNFTFDQGPDIDRDFSNKIKAELLLDDDQLILSEISLSAEDVMRSQVLLDHVTAIEWTFLSKPEAGDFGKDLTRSDWSEAAMPLAVRLTVHLDDETSIQFAFFTNTPTFEISR